MYPELFRIGDFIVPAYGFLIMVGAGIGFFYMKYATKKELGIDGDKIKTLAILMVFGAFVGGKLFFYLEKPSYYFNPLSNMMVDFRSGFVFYGSLLFVIPLAIWFFRREKWPAWPMLDHFAITATIVHGFGRLGCFLAGCCYGLPTKSAVGVVFTDLKSKAPLDQHLHPTQLYSFSLIFALFLLLLMFKRHKRFEGQLFFIYIAVYAAGRSVIEIFRGDLRRGFVLENWISHSQFISILLITIVTWLYWKRSRNIHRL